MRSTLMGLALAGALFGSPQPAAAQHKTWYLAEGATNDFFQEEILIANPNAGPATVSISFLKSDTTQVPFNVTIPGTSRYTLRVNEVAGLENANASAVVTSDVDILVERSMYWPGPTRLGGHNAVAVPAPALKWYLAEGALGFFDTFILIANPNDTAAAVTVTYLRTGDTPLTANYTVQPRSRHTIRVQDDQPNAGAFATIVESTNGVTVVVERAMYFKEHSGGHDAVGVTEPATGWAFAEGFTGPGFATYLLLANPSATAAEVTVLYAFDDGTAPLQQKYTVQPMTRETVGTHEFPALQNRAFSIGVLSTNGVPIVAERAMYFGDFSDGHATAGTGLGTKWGFAEGLEDQFGGPIAYETFFLLANPNTSAADVRATFYREDGTGVVRTFSVPPQSRFTLQADAITELSNQRFAAFFESTNGVTISAERSVYWSGRDGGHGSTGTLWTGTIAEPPAPAAATIASVTPNKAKPGAVVDIAGTNLHRDTKVTFDGINAPVIAVRSSSRITVQAPNHAAGAVNVGVNGPTGAGTLNGGFTYEEAAPPPPPPPPPNRTPDPPAGQLLPLPNMAGIVAEVAAQFPGALRNSCQEHGGSWEFLDRVVERLRQVDTRWGYNCKRGNCPDISQDVVAYHAGAGPEENGVPETYTVDVISGHCGGNPVWWWGPHQYVPGPGAARWHSRFRF